MLAAAAATHQSYRDHGLSSKRVQDSLPFTLGLSFKGFIAKKKLRAWEKLRATDYFDMTLLLNWWTEAMKLYIIVDLSSLKVYKQVASIAQSITTRGCQKTIWRLPEIWWNVFNLKASVSALEVNKGPSHYKGDWLPLHINHKSFCAFMTL